jgi:D-methionine transport system substrate-binding protein
MKFARTITLLCLMLSLLSACAPAPSDERSIRLGVIAGPEAELMEFVKQLAAQDYDLNIELVQFSDYTMPNIALHDGSIDANIFQHQPYLDAMLHSRNYQLASVGKTFIFPMGIYSTSLNSLAELPDGASVVIPNDPSNQARALLLLQQAGLIELAPDITITGSLQDIIKNPKQLKISGLNAAQLPRALQDVSLAVINTNYAIAAKLNYEEALFTETYDSPYANVIVVRATEKDAAKFQRLVEIMHSAVVTEKAQQIFKQAVISAW